MTKTDTSAPFPASAGPLRIPVSPGELLDKVTILELKDERIVDASKLANVRRELAILRDEARANLQFDAALLDFTARLKAVNARLWDCEDVIRECERQKDFGERFIDTARAIYRNNDERAEIKRLINLHLGALIVEEKSYAAY